MNALVIINNKIYLEQEKQPLEPSGFSHKGALQLNKQLDVVKCHECGAWLDFLPPHIRKVHGLTAREYRVKHGFRASSGGLCNVANKNSRAARAATARAGIKDKAPVRRTKPKGTRRYISTLNLSDNCPVQIPARLKKLAEELGRTPTAQEAYSRRISKAAVKHKFGTYNLALVAAQIVPNKLQTRNYYKAQPAQ